ncbi:MAG: DUF192 domain-containing protein [Gemmatimonadetes bacterium]|nr:DUF192 domain-containing protein [Gemmatimonadota bacterium]
MALKVVNETRGSVLGEQVDLADWWWPRLRGLIGHGPLEEGQGLLMVPCRGVHMYGMRYPIDVAFMDEEREVVALYRGLAPGARSKWHGEARFALELPEGTLGSTGTLLGDHLSWSEAA